MVAIFFNLNKLLQNYSEVYQHGAVVTTAVSHIKVAGFKLSSSCSYSRALPHSRKIAAD
jgi:hypothetical protein